VTVLFEGEIHVHYGYIFLSTSDDTPDLMETRRGQRNGLCGAAVVGDLSLVTGTHTGPVPLRVEWSAAEPPVDAQWEDVVEASFTPLSAAATLSAFEEFHPVRLPGVGNLRVRFCADGMDDARQQDAVPVGLPPATERFPLQPTERFPLQPTERFPLQPTERFPLQPTERYLLQLWPAEPGPDAVLRETSQFAGYWHSEARALPPPPTAAEREAAARAAAEQARLAAEQAAERRELVQWAGRRPSPRLRDLGGNVLSVARSDRGLLESFEALDAGTQRAAARWLARRAFEIAELDRLKWVRPALAALDAGAPLPEPFTDLAAVFPLVRPAGRATFHIRLVNRAAGPPPSKARVHRPSFAVPAIFSATDPDPLRALVDTFSHAAATFDDRRDELVSELRRRWLAAPG
jgi:hypothetical protein